MKKLLITVAIILGIMATQPTDAKVQYINGKFVLVDDSKEQTSDKRLPDYPIKGKDSKITFYPCYISAKGKIYIIRKKKTNGEEYKSYLKKEEQERLKKEIGL